ncbi:MAG: Fe-S cluster assembly protein SufD [Flammeovirgaceae bacterium]|nr:Fe-S cluster assembly protein SufD [Flammeovirgaceae bacterium]
MSSPVSSNVVESIIDQFGADHFKSAQQLRASALNELKKSGLPHAKHEEYKFTHLTKVLEKDFNAKHFNTSETNTGKFDLHLLPELEADHIVLVNGHFKKELSTLKNSAKDISIRSLEDVLNENNELLTDSFDTLRSAYKDPFSSLNTSFWTGGLYIQVPGNTQLKYPVVIYNFYDSRHDNILINSRILGMIGNDSAMQIIERSENIGENKVFNNSTEEFIVGEKATFSFYKIQNEKKDLTQINNTLVHQKESSKLSHGIFTFNGSMIRNNTTVVIDGENCESQMNGLYLINDKSHVDNHSVVDHKKPNSFSNELYKGVLDGQSKGVFNGKIFVRPHAQKTNAFQSNRNILLTDTATINTKPQLEIWADDVKCSHGCTSGQLDDEALFYLQSRGIDKSTAKAILLYAFAYEVVEGISNEYLKNYLDKLITEKLHIPNP